MRIRDWISDVCSSDLSNTYRSYRVWLRYAISISSMATQDRRVQHSRMKMTDTPSKKTEDYKDTVFLPVTAFPMKAGLAQKEPAMAERWTKLGIYRSEEHTSELQSLMRNSYAVFCFKKKK